MIDAQGVFLMGTRRVRGAGESKCNLRINKLSPKRALHTVSKTYLLYCIQCSCTVCLQFSPFYRSPRRSFISARHGGRAEKAMANSIVSRTPTENVNASVDSSNEQPFSDHRAFRAVVVLNRLMSRLVTATSATPDKTQRPFCM